MDFPFFRSQWANPYVSNHYDPPEAMRTPPKVVQIPVHFVGSDSDRRSSSALKIQNAFRGFLVRKSVKRIMAAKKEVDEIESRVSRSEEVELIKKDGKERLKVNETLMALLFKLDSIRGIDAGVRDCRRAVIKKAIALQERVDAIASSSGIDQKIDTQILADQTDQAEVRQALEIQDSAAQNSDVVDPEGGSGVQGVEEGNNEGEVEGFEETRLENVMNSEGSEANNSDKKEEGGGDSEMNVEESNTVDSREKEEFGFDSEMNGDEETCVEKVMIENVKMDVGPEVNNEEEICEKNLAPEVNNEEEICEKNLALSECVEESEEASQMDNGIDGDAEGKDVGDDNKRNRELLEKMMEDNEKMMKMMSQLFERNEAQTRILNTLTHRVEQLEKAFVCDRIKRKKKRHSA